MYNFVLIFTCNNIKLIHFALANKRSRFICIKISIKNVAKYISFNFSSRFMRINYTFIIYGEYSIAYNIVVHSYIDNLYVLIIAKIYVLIRALFVNLWFLIFIKSYFGYERINYKVFCVVFFKKNKKNK